MKTSQQIDLAFKNKEENQHKEEHRHQFTQI